MEIGERRCADECELCGRKGMEGNKQEEKPKDMRPSVAVRTTADGVGAREWREMGGEKRLVDMSKRSCADEC